MKVDIALAYELAKFNGETLTRRRLCDKGMGAFGEFTLYMPMKDYTCGEIFQSTEKTTPVYFRFARVTDIKSNADSLRDLRTLSARFFGKTDFYDLLCASAPVFFTDDIEKLPSLLKCLNPKISRDLTNYSLFWEFVANNPETAYLLLWLFSNKSTIKSYRTMCFYSINTYLWYNSKGENFFVRYEWSPITEVKNISRQESEFLAGYDPNAAIRDFSDTIENEEKIEFELSVQIVPLAQKDDFEFDLLDTSKDWPKAEIESMKIGKVTIKRLAEQNEENGIQLNPRNLIKGVGLTPCKLLHAMCVAITDEQRHRLGASFKEPISICNECEVTVEKRSEPLEKNNFSQARKFYLSLSDNDKNAIIENILDSIMFVDESIQEKVVDSLTSIDEELGAVISMGLDL